MQRGHNKNAITFHGDMQHVGTCNVPVFVCSIADLRQNVSKEHEVVKKKEMDQGAKASYGYGGKFGVEKDRMDKVRLEKNRVLGLKVTSM